MKNPPPITTTDKGFHPRPAGFSQGESPSASFCQLIRVLGVEPKEHVMPSVSALLVNRLLRNVPGLPGNLT